jgi:hypothetical protein
VIGNHPLALATLIFAAERQAHAEARRLLAAALCQSGTLRFRRV